MAQTKTNSKTTAVSKRKPKAAKPTSIRWLVDVPVESAAVLEQVLRQFHAQLTVQPAPLQASLAPPERPVFADEDEEMTWLAEHDRPAFLKLKAKHWKEDLEDAARSLRGEPSNSISWEEFKLELQAEKLL
jgi:hypothetical protein